MKLGISERALVYGRALMPYFLFISCGICDWISTYIGINYFGLVESNPNVVFTASGFVACGLFFLVSRTSLFSILKGWKNKIVFVWCLLILIPAIWNISLMMVVYR